MITANEARAMMPQNAVASWIQKTDRNIEEAASGNSNYTIVPRDVRDDWKTVMINQDQFFDWDFKPMRLFFKNYLDAGFSIVIHSGQDTERLQLNAGIKVSDKITITW
jgi:hypothetical protein